MIFCLEKNFVAPQKNIYFQPKEKVLQEHGNILLTLKSINKLFQLKRVNILQMSISQNHAYMVERPGRFQKQQNVNNCIGTKSYFLYQKMVLLNLIHLFSPPFVPAILLMTHICRWNKVPIQFCKFDLPMLHFVELVISSPVLFFWVIYCDWNWINEVARRVWFCSGNDIGRKTLIKFDIFPPLLQVNNYEIVVNFSISAITWHEIQQLSINLPEFVLFNF